MLSRIVTPALTAMAIVMTAFFVPGLSVSAQDSSICGWIENPGSNTGALAPILTLSGTNEVIELLLLEPVSQLMDLGIPGYFRVYDPVFDYPGFMTSFTRIEKVSTCSPPPERPLVDAGRYVADVTVPDGTTFAPNTRFTKTWRVQNTGTTTWSANYELVFVSGDSLGYGGTSKLGRTVRPQETTDISIQLTAPSKSGSYKGVWKLSNAQRQLFGTQLTTAIKVSGATQLPDFKLPYAKDVKVYWTGGPHAYLMGGQFGDLYSTGQGSGMDFANGESFQVLAMAAGKVIDASCNNPGLGCQVAIKHNIGGSVLVYGHLREGSIAVSKNQTVRQGTVLGLSGKTGSGAGGNIHLHIELRDGSGGCRVQCMANPAFGNPIGWDDLVPLVDGWYIGGYLADTEGKQSRNYDGSAVKGTAIDLVYNFPYYDNGKLTQVKAVRVHSGFRCNLISGKPATDCELPENHTNPSGQTQFARDDGKGIAFPSNQTARQPANKAGYLTSSNAPVR